MTAQSNITPESIVNDLRYLQLLSRSFPTIADASTEIINLEAILNLPKGTEHFLTDVHGEYEAFQHVLKNASGAVKRKVNEIFGNTLREAEKKEICTLIYYPEEKLQLVKAREKDLDDWYLITLNQLVKVCQNVSSKYTRSKVRKSLPAEFSYIIQELLHESSIEPNKHAYINVIISTIITTKRADDFIIAMCNLIQRLTIDSLHIVGDIYDRGPGAHIIMDTLCNYHNFDIQWGNHDILWMGAACGSQACIAAVVKNCLSYNNISVLEQGYGISLRPLVLFAEKTYDEPDPTKAAKKAITLVGSEAMLEDFKRKSGSDDYRNATGIMRETFVKVVNDDVSGMLEDVTVPVLLVWGENDEAAPLWMGKQMEAKMKNAGLAIFEGDDHFAYFNQSARFNRCLDVFLKEDWEE